MGDILFRNPDFPYETKKPSMCPLSVQVRPGVCFFRIEFKIFELAHFSDDVCIRDTATIITGASEDPATPICGNMTNHATSFRVEPNTTMMLSIVTQAAHRFSIQITQQFCDDVPYFVSGT